MTGFTPLSDEQEFRIQQAKDLLGNLISSRAAWIHEEEQKPSPDQSKIDTWDKEQGEYFQVQRRVVLMDNSELNAVFEKYGQARREA